MGVEPDAVTVRALIDLNPVPFAGDQIVAALRALHVVRLAFALGGGPHDCRVLLPQQLGVATRKYSSSFLLGRSCVTARTMEAARVAGPGGAASAAYRPRDWQPARVPVATTILRNSDARPI